ncbi:MAG: nitroreductase family protein [Endomicrobiales bacterium]|nr:nitroreductase family protein [Endomicrobiales bacterium]
MKTLDQLIGERRSVRKYLNKPVEREKIRQVIEAARFAPSACNKQPWRFVVIDDPELKGEFVGRGLAGGVAVPNKWAATAPVVIVAASELSLMTHNIAERIQGVEYHLIDLGIALEHLVLKAEDLGLGTCYIGWFDAKGIQKFLGLPASWKVECLVTLGYPQEVPGATQRKDFGDICVFNKEGVA